MCLALDFYQLPQVFTSDQRKFLTVTDPKFVFFVLTESLKKARRL